MSALQQDSSYLQIELIELYRFHASAVKVERGIIVYLIKKMKNVRVLNVEFQDDKYIDNSLSLENDEFIVWLRLSVSHLQLR
jgi:hypothetical protein